MPETNDPRPGSRSKTKPKPAAPEPARKSLAEKLVEVALEVDHVEKGGHNDKQNYDFVQAADVLRAIRHGLLSRGVLVVPGAHSPELTTWQTRNGATTILTTVALQYRFLDAETGDEIVVPWIAQGTDTGGDKGIYKAFTGGLKYVLLQTFLVPTGDDPEDDRTTAAPEPEQPQRPAVQTIPRERAERIVQAARGKGVDRTVFEAKLAELGFSRVVDLSVDAAEAAEAWIAAEPEAKS